MEDEEEEEKLEERGRLELKENKARLSPPAKLKERAIASPIVILQNASKCPTLLHFTAQHLHFLLLCPQGQ
jgi:hypothetical protein